MRDFSRVKRIVIKVGTNVLSAQGKVDTGFLRVVAKEIAELKMKDLNASGVESAMRQVEGTARSMGIQVVD